LQGRLIPTRHHADEGPMDLFFRQPHGVVVGTVRCARWSLRHMRLGSLALSNVLASIVFSSDHCWLPAA
jgi:hypothetical protein